MLLQWGGCRVEKKSIENTICSTVCWWNYSPRVLKFYLIVQVFKKRVANDPKGILKTWDPNDKNVCNYKGFLCDLYPANKQQTVAGVDFIGFQFAGKEGEGLTLDGFIEKLIDITTFHAHSNGFTGGIPKEISTIPYFFELDLSNKKLYSPFPQGILGAKNSPTWTFGLTLFPAPFHLNCSHLTWTQSSSTTTILTKTFPITLAPRQPLI